MKTGRKTRVGSDRRKSSVVVTKGVANDGRDQARARRIAAKQARQEAQRHRVRAKRIKKAIAIGIALAFLVGIVAFNFYRRQMTEAAILAAGCSDIQRLKDEGGRMHLPEVNSVYDEYRSNPPTSGPHSELTAEWGFYDIPVAKELLVHNLEHGDIVIHYKELTEEETDRLQDFVESYPESIIAVPNGSIEVPIALTSWAHLQTCPRFSVPAIQAFINARCGQGPEPLAVCDRRLMSRF